MVKCYSCLLAWKHVHHFFWWDSSNAWLVGRVYCIPLWLQQILNGLKSNPMLPSWTIMTITWYTSNSGFWVDIKQLILCSIIRLWYCALNDDIILASMGWNLLVVLSGRNSNWVMHNLDPMIGIWCLEKLSTRSRTLCSPDVTILASKSSINLSNDCDVIQAFLLDAPKVPIF